MSMPMVGPLTASTRSSRDERYYVVVSSSSSEDAGRHVFAHEQPRGNGGIDAAGRPFNDFSWDQFSLRLRSCLWTAGRSFGRMRVSRFGAISKKHAKVRFAIEAIRRTPSDQPLLSAFASFVAFAGYCFSSSGRLLSWLLRRLGP